ncbi:MAG: hypothetical protein LAP21_16240 [Acidobacteriia bacterium]|nr:hypothetical protein [Terriglobia bacterium]
MKKDELHISDYVRMSANHSPNTIPGSKPDVSEAEIHRLDMKLKQLSRDMENLDEEQILDKLADQVCLMTDDEINDWYNLLTVGEDNVSQVRAGSGHPDEQDRRDHKAAREHVRPGSSTARNALFNDAYIQRLRDGDPSTTAHFFAHFGGLLRIKLEYRRVSSDLITEMVDAILEQILAAVKKDGLPKPSRLGALVNSTCNDMVAEQHRPHSNDHLQGPAVIRHIAISPSDHGEARRKRVRAVWGTLPPKDRDVLRTVLVGECDEDEARPKFVDQAYKRQLLNRARRQHRDLEKPVSDGLRCLL